MKNTPLTTTLCCAAALGLLACTAFITPVCAQAVTFGAKTDFAVGYQPYSVAIGDVNSDGMPDLVTANGGGNSVSVRLGTGDGNFGAATAFATGSLPFSVVIRDVSGDGRPDLVVANYGSNSVSMLQGTGDGSFRPATDSAVGFTPWSVAVSDVNGDGHPDLATANGSQNSVSVLLGLGGGRFGTNTDYSTNAVSGPGTRPYSVVIGDVNGDGHPDLVTANYLSSNVSVFLGTGSGSFGAATNLSAGAGVASVAVGDVNGDGQADLVAANGASTVSVLPGTGSGSFGAVIPFAVGAVPYSVVIQDVSGDGHLDLVTANTNSNSVSVLLSTGSGSFSDAIQFAVGSEPYSVAVVDVNGDGRPDLATANFNGGNASVLLNTTPPSVTLNTENILVNATTLTLTGTFFDAGTPANNTVAFTPSGTGTVTGATATSLTVTSLSGLSAGALNAVVTTNSQSSGAPVQVATVSGIAATFNAAADVPFTAASPSIGGVAALTLGFAPTVGTSLTVIKNTGTAFISGQFSNLANGATVNLSFGGTDYPFVAWYYGGEGNNDLVLLWPYTGLAAWGYNATGQLGDNSTTHRPAPVGVVQSGVLHGKTIVQVARGFSHSLALCSDGTVAAWGENFYGQLGDNSTTNQPVPVAVDTGVLAGKTVVAVAAGRFHSLALCSDGTVAAWGFNSFGQLGDNATTNRQAPVAVNTVSGTSALFGKSVVAVVAGHVHSLALCSDGTVVAWGNNGSGRLGDNSQIHRQAPVVVNTVSGTSALSGKSVVALAAGDGHSLALCSDGTVAAWGYNENGQLGDNSMTQRRVPVAVNVGAGPSALSGKSVVALAAGNNHSLALCSDGTVAAWGDNGIGQLGDNNPSIFVPVPVAVNVEAGTSALSGRSVVAIAAGVTHSLALCSDGTVAAWGFNGFGQLGDNSLIDYHSVPVAVDVTVGTSALAGRPVSGLSVSPGALYSIAIYSLMTTPAPEIAVTGKGVEIPQGDATPGTSDGTDFGSVALLSTQVTHSFAIVGMGNLPLNLTGTPLVTLSGPGAAAFKVTLAPANAVVAGGSTPFAITFDPTLPGAYAATVTIYSDAASHPGFSFAISGFGALSTALKQTITFAPPATVYLGQSPLSLSAYASSGMPVTLSVMPVGTTAAGASLAGNALSFTGTGTIKVQAVQAGGGNYAAAPTVVKTITVKANPTVLTLLDLSQPYTGTPRAISTLGGNGEVTVEYKMGTAFGSTVPTNAGSYPVRATDSKGTKTGTLVIAKVPLFVTPTDQRKFVGQDNPPLTLTYSGWVNGESEALVTSVPVLKTTATKTSAGGVYPITASGGGVLSGNYAFIYQQGALVVESFAASYEALLTEDGGSGLIGKLDITITASNISFTGKLYCTHEKAALSLNGPLLASPGSESAAGIAIVTSSGIPYVVNISLGIDGSLSASVTREFRAYATASTGRRSLAGKTVPYSGAHTAVLEPATPAANNVPAGAGWATAAISTKGVMTLAGRLGDGTTFTATLLPDDASDPTYRLWLQPYKTGAATRLQSYFGGAFTLLPHPALAGRRYLEAAALTWAKAGLTSDATYPAGFGPVSTVLMLDPWLPPATSFPLATRLGLTNSSFQVLHSDTGSTLNGNLPTSVSLGTTNIVTVTTPAANTTKWKTTLVPTTGLFSGSFELADTLPKPRSVTFSGVLRQPAAEPDVLIGDGHYLLPPLTGTEKTTGEVMFMRP